MGKMWPFLAVLLAGCGTSLPAQPKHYEVVNSRSKGAHMVYIPPEYAKDQSAYEHAIRSICDDPQQVYIVLFWNDRSKVWPAGQSEMSDEQVAAQVAGYNRNPNSGLNRFYWLRDGNRIDVGPVP
jgi:hypothetical protein